ncbi:MAG TPA: hypothetical protein VM286_00650 [Candidatus Thermoplasmatota archaeon]|nr:hypothetical protein [Candidatus Thermoplasmatota archaeon]
MRCLTCDHELPDDAFACPGCGSRRMELPVVTASAVPLEPPRKRHRVRNALVLLLVAGLAVALAGQATHMLGGDDSPPAKATKKAPGKGAGTGTKAAPRPSTSAAPAQDALRLYLDPIPFDIPNAQAAHDATRAAIQAWADRGHSVAEVDDPDDADRTVHYEQEWRGEGLQRESSPIGVGLGDSACDGTWQAYRAESLQQLAAHAIGHALGEDDTSAAGDVMDPDYRPLHEGPCQVAHGQGVVQRGTPAGKAFTLEAPRTVAYTMQEAYGALLDVCFVPTADWDAFAAGAAVGSACQSGVAQAQDSAALAAGDYMLGFRCQDSMGQCQVEYAIAVAE